MIYRLIYSDTEIIDLFPAAGVTGTPYNIFEGTAEQVQAKVTELQLQDPQQLMSILTS